jgi:hypothetical protein
MVCEALTRIQFMLLLAPCPNVKMLLTPCVKEKYMEAMFVVT